MPSERPKYPMLWIVVTDADGQLVFEGDTDHWRDCFFDNAYRNVIEDFCKQEGWNVCVSFP